MVSGDGVGGGVVGDAGGDTSKSLKEKGKVFELQPTSQYRKKPYSPCHTLV